MKYNIAPSAELMKALKQVGAEYRDWALVALDCDDQILWNVSSRTAAIGLCTFALDALRTDLQNDLRAKDSE